MKIVVLGTGRVGGAIALDLAKDAEFQVTVADVSQASLDAVKRPDIATIQADLGDAAQVERVVKDHDLVVGAMPGSMGLETMRRVLQCKKDIVDISFFGEDPFVLDDLAREHDLVAIMDIGIAPGFWNVIIGYLETVLDEVRSCLCYVGGLPAQRTWPYDYKAPFSPSDVVEEYTRPARYVVDGKVVTKPALSEPELIDFPGVGTLEAFNTDGLRTLITTCKAPMMKEKTLRYPGHIEKMRVLRETGFFSKEPIDVGGVKVRPLDFTSKLLFPVWHLGEGEEDLTVMQVVIEGVRQGKRVRHTYDMLDRYDRATGTTSMARTTGYTCTAAVRAFAKGLYRRKGLSPPEYMGREKGVYEFMRDDLAKRGVVLTERVEELSG
jgi:saccharopine dehydrogenase-like NADP-dependent oxidoreductase